MIRLFRRRPPPVEVPGLDAHVAEVMSVIASAATDGPPGRPDANRVARAEVWLRSEAHGRNPDFRDYDAPEHVVQARALLQPSITREEGPTT